MGHLVKNLAFFKIGWVACVMFAATGAPLLATLSVAAVAVVHLLGVRAPVKEALLLLAAAVIGLGWESFMVWTGLVRYPGHEYTVLAPYWIVAMWVLFATTINHGLRWAKRSLWVASIAGLLGGPLAFYGGMNLGAVEFSHMAAALVLIGLGWALLLPVLTLVADTIIDSPMLEPRSNQAGDSGRRRLSHLELGYE